MDIEIIIIELVQSYPIIYDKSRKDFRDYLAKEKVWSNISRVVGAPVSECKCKWQRLRERFSRELKSHNLGVNSDGGPTRPEWALYKNMLFLKNHVKARSAKSFTTYRESKPDTSAMCLSNTWDNFDQAPEQIQEYQQNLSRLDPDKATTEFVDIDRFAPDAFRASTTQMDVSRAMSTEPHTETSHSSTYSGNQARKRKSIDDDDEDEEDLKINSTIGVITDFLKRKSAEDSNMAFGTFVGLTLRELPKNKKMALRLKILQAIQEVDNL